MGILLLKLFLAPLLVVASTLAGRRWGPDVTGILVALPIVAGPILFIAYQQHGADFASDAARSSLLGLVSLAAFAVVFSCAARRFGWLPALATSWVAVLAVDAGLSIVHVPTLVALAVTLVAAVAGMMVRPRIEPALPGGSVHPSWDLPGRALATGALVLTVTTAASVLGPHWTGLLAPFPVATSVVAAFVHARHGPSVTTRTLAGVLMGLFGFATFCLTVAVLVRPVGGAAFALGAASTVIVQLLALRMRAVIHRRTGPPMRVRGRGRSRDQRRDRGAGWRGRSTHART